MVVVDRADGRCRIWVSVLGRGGMADELLDRIELGRPRHQAFIASPPGAWDYNRHAGRGQNLTPRFVGHCALAINHREHTQPGKTSVTDDAYRSGANG